MKTTNFQSTIISAIIMVIASIFSLNAQSYNFFFDRKYSEDQLVSKIKYEEKYTGLYEKTGLYEYAYDESGKLQKETFSKWDEKKSIWIPQYCINHTYSVINNTITLEYIKWNRKDKQYNDLTEKAIYQLDETGNILTWTFIDKKGNKSEIFTSNKESIDHAYNAFQIK